MDKPQNYALPLTRDELLVFARLADRAAASSVLSVEHGSELYVVVRMVAYIREVLRVDVGKPRLKAETDAAADRVDAAGV